MVTIYDTSLRDGLQGEKISLNLNDKLLAIKELDKLGIHYIEGGFPLASDNEMKFFEEAAKVKLKHSKIVAFGSTKKPTIAVEDDFHMQALLKANTEVITIVGKTWLKHVSDVIKTTPEENLKMIGESVKYLKSQGKEVIYDAEHFFDGFQHDPDYALATLRAATDNGADLIVLCDTNGGIIHTQLIETLKVVSQEKGLKFGVHFHNDTDSAVSNSIISLDYGATQIQGTINGWGERCGNTNLISVLGNLFFKSNVEVVTAEQMTYLTHVSHYFDELANVTPFYKQAYVGQSAFAHKAGQHADVILKNSSIMEHIDSAKVGNSRRILLSELAGKASIVFKLEKFGNYDKSSPEVDELIKVLKHKEQEGFEFEAGEASFELIARKSLKRYRPIIQGMEYRVDIQNEKKDAEVVSKSNTWAFVKVLVDGREFSGDATSVGPVGALDMALRKAFSHVNSQSGSDYDFIKCIQLKDYKVRVINEKQTEAKVRVNIRSCGKFNDETTYWGTTGVSENIIDASWQALIDSFDFAFNEYM